MALTRRSFIASSAAFAAAGCASIGDAGGAADAPRFEFGKDGAFTFLQLTDLHLKPNGRALHPRVERVLRAAFAKHAPSLLVLTGDNVNGQEGDVNAHGKFEETVDPLIDLFRSARIPFCVTFGNHDSERKGPGRFSRQEQYDYYRSRGGELHVLELQRRQSRGARVHRASRRNLRHLDIRRIRLLSRDAAMPSRHCATARRRRHIGAKRKMWRRVDKSVSARAACRGSCRTGLRAANSCATGELQR